MNLNISQKINENNSIRELLLLAIVVGIVPLIVFLKIIPIGDTLLLFWKGEPYNFDFYSYYKSIAVTVIGACSLLFLLLKGFIGSKNRKKTYAYIPMVVFSLFVIISTLLSAHKSVALRGFFDRYEGAFVILSYMIILFSSINLVNSKRQIKFLLGCLIVSSLFIICIGASQFFKMDLFSTEFGKQLILPKSHSYLANQMESTLESTMVYGTMYHSNYVGSYMAMLFPLAISLFLLVKNPYHKALLAIYSILTIFILLGSRSRAGILGVVFSLLLLIILHRKQLLNNWKLIMVLGIIGIVGLVIMNGITGGALVGKIMSITSDPRLAINSVGFENMGIKDNSLKLKISGSTLEIVNEGNYSISFRDNEGEFLEPNYSHETGKLIFEDDNYKSYELAINAFNGGTVITVNNEGIQVSFLITKESFQIINHLGEAVDLVDIPKWGFEGRESLGSARGYIWSRSIPLLKKTWLVGFGPDTFAMHFPQHDFVGKLQSYGTTNIIVDKAHNFYLQTAINTGGISLIALLGLFITYIISSIKLYFKDPLEDFYSWIGVSTLLAVVGYLVAGMFNDSVVSVAPVFWVLLGIGISVNIKVKNEKINKDDDKEFINL